MADTTSKHILQIDDKGTLKSMTKEAKNFVKQLEKAQELSGGIYTPKSVAAARAARQRDAGQQSGLARSVGRDSGTGAGARDFAKQAEGLGGLVRLYATFAANIFAATAAFGALSRAADTTNMVKGLDQLGAAAGRNLGSLAKRVMETTDNAVSLREAMESVVKASSAGLSDQQILKLSASANKAAIALGLNMTDALSRLTRGISKIEPELLDELGIFVRVDDAVNKYALSVGKSVASISDFERRQAFANAVLDQAQKKFGEIKIDANPYTKLAATLQNVAQSGLEAVNKVLGPISKLLADSPTALGAGIAYIATLLAKQAIPALGQWRQGLRAAAEESAVTANKFASSMGDKFQTKLENLFNIPLITKQLDAAKLKLQELEKGLVPVNFKKINSRSAEALQKEGVTEEEQLKRVNKLIADKEKRIEELSKSTEAKDVRAAARANSELKNLKELGSQLQANNAYNLQKLTLLELEKRKEDAWEKAQKVADTAPRKGWFFRKTDPENIELQRAIDLKKQSIALNAVAAASETARIAGVRLAWQELNKTVKDEGLTGLQKYTTLAKGGMTAVASRIMGVASAMGNVGMVIGVAVAAGAALNAMFSKNSKETAAFDSSLEHLEGSIKTVGNTMDFISKKPFLEQMSPASMQAKAAALTNLADSVAKAADDFERAQSAANWWDTGVDFSLRLFGKDLNTQMASRMSQAIEAAVKAAETSAEASGIRDRMRKALGVEDLSAKGIAASGNANFAAGGQELAKLGKLATDATLPMRRLSETIEAGSTSMKELGKSLVASDPISKVGQDLLKVGTTLDEALKSPKDSLEAMRSLTKDTASLSLLPAERRKELVSYSAEIEDIIAKTNMYQGALKGVEEALIKNKIEHDRLSEIEEASGYAASTEAASRGSQIADMERMADFLRKSIAEQTSRQQRFVELFTGAGKEIFKRGSDLLERGVSTAFAQAALTIKKATFSDATGAAKIVIDSNIQREDLKIQMASLDMQASLVAVMEETKLIQQRQLDATLRAELEKDPAKNEKAISESLERDKAMDEAIKKLRSIGSLTQKDFTTGPAAPYLQNVQAASAGLRAQRASLGAQYKAVDITERKQLENDRFLAAQRLKDEKIKIAALDKEMLDILSSTVSLESASLLTQKQAAETRVIDLNNEKQRAELERAKQVADEAYSAALKGKKKDEQEATKLEVDRASDRIKNFDEQVSRATLLRDISNEIKRIENETVNRDRWLSITYAIADGYREIKEQNLSLQEVQIDILEKAGVYSEQDIAKKRASLELSKQTLSAESEITELKRQQKAERTTLETKVAATKEVRDKAPAVDYAKADEAYQNELKAFEQLTDYQEQQLKNLENINALKLQGIELTNKQNVEQAKYNDLITEVSKFTEHMIGAFGRVGEAIGSIAESAAKWQEKDRQYEEEKRKIRESISGDEDEETMSKARIKYATLENKQSREALGTQIAMLGAVKKLFKEKTFAYKAIDALEKANHVASLARMAESMIMSIKSMFVDTGAGVSKLFAQGGWAGFAGAAAFLALMASLGGKGGGVSKASIGEEQQKLQGTGQKFNEKGEVVNRAGGVLGDPTEKADSITTAISAIEKHTFDTLEYSNSMLKELIGVRKNTEVLGSLIMQSGIAFKGVNPDGSIKYGQTAPRMRSATLNPGGAFAYGAEQLGTGGLAQVMKSFGMEDTGLGRFTAKISNAIWGGSIKTELTDIGIQFNTNMKDTINILKEGGEGLNSIYEKVKATEKGGLFRKDKITEDTKYSDLETKQAEAFGTIFEGIYDTVLAAAEALGQDKTLSETLAASFNLDFKASLKDLKGEDLTEAIEAELSVNFNALAETVLQPFMVMRKPAEEFGETVVRLAREVQVSALAFKQASLSIGDMSQFQKVGESLALTTVRITEAFIDAAGGLDNFVEKTQFFAENFRTEAQRLAPIQAAVTARMKELNLAHVDTREEFADAVTAAVAMGPAGAELYGALMDVAQGFDMVADAAERAAEETEKKQKDINNKIFDQEQEIRKLENRAYEARFVAREKEISDLDKMDTTANKVLVTNQRRIHALQDEAEITSLLIKAHSALGYSYNALMMQRQIELSNLTGTAKALQNYIYEAEDAAKTQALSLELLEAQGRETEAVNERRQLELRGLSAVDQQLKIRIWRLQDEKKILDQSRSQQVRILELLGKSEQALAITRAQELASMDAQLRPAQEYIYALEDQLTLKEKLKTAYEKETEGIKNTINALKESSNALKQYKLDLLGGDKSILTPTQKYQQAKAEALRLAAIASGPAVSEADKQAQADAISKLPSSIDKWLETSRIVFASSSSYTNDFNSAIGILDSLGASIDAQLTDAEKQLKILQDNTTILDIIKENTGSTSSILTQYLEAVTRTNNLTTTPITTAAVTRAAAEFDPSTGNLIGTSGKSLGTLASIKDYIGIDPMAAYRALVPEGVKSTMADYILGVPPGTVAQWAVSRGLPAFANGGLLSGRGLVGEDGPEVVDFNTPGRIYNANNTATMIGNFNQLLNEFRGLRAEVNMLRKEQTEQTGHLIGTNVISTDKVVDSIQEAANSSSTNSIWNNRNTLKIA